VRLGVARALVGGEWVDGDAEVLDGRVAAVGLGTPRGSKVAVPGLVDLQVNGFAGIDFSIADGDELTRAGEALVASGTTAFQPTLVTAPIEEMAAAVERIGEWDRARPTGASPHLIGLHLEGPFISPDRPGAHDPASVMGPDRETLDRLLAAGSKASSWGGARLVSQVTLAPELPGALELIDALVARGVVVSLGHTEAEAATAHAAFDRGASAVTHLFNAMRRPAPRDPGIAFVALGREDSFVTLIVDGHHLADDTVRMAARAAGERLVLVSDAVAAAGAPDGTYSLGGRVPIHSDGGVVRTADGLLAGTSLTMLDAVRNLHALGIPLASAIHTATAAPARMSRRPDLGGLAPGTPADLLVLDDTLTLTAVLLAGNSHL
jgi:N-acetylglucosamine-6-phosphate deacetylase